MNNIMGVLQILLDRQRLYTAQLMFISTLLINIKLWGFRWEYLLFIPVWVLFSWFDYKVLFPSHLKAAANINPVITEIQNNVKEILENDKKRNK